MQYTVNQLYDVLHQKVYSIYDIFKNFFGDNYVDLQLSVVDIAYIRDILTELQIDASGTDENNNDLFEISDSTLEHIQGELYDNRAIIYVWWPSVTVTNENDRSVVIQDLYAKVEITYDGRIPFENIGFLLNRATYTSEQFRSDYLHSHIQSIPKNDFTEFMRPCLGHGPIRNTIGTLQIEYDEITWMLFCQELAMYVTVESLSGGPWKRLENIGNLHRLSRYSRYDYRISSKVSFTNTFSEGVLKDFVKYYLEKGHLSFNFKEKKFIPGMPFYDYIIDISNSFIDYYNEYLHTDANRLARVSSSLLVKAIVVNGKFYTADSSGNASNYNFNDYRGKYVLTFKNRAIRISIIESEQSEATITTVLRSEVALYIMENILKVINFRFKNGHNIQNGGSEETPSTDQKVYYL